MSEWKHRILNRDSDNQHGICAVCGRVKLKKKNQGKRFACSIAEKKWDNHHKDNLRKHGVTLEWYHNQLALQNNSCAICRKQPGEGKKLCVDHDHTSNQVRGLLCNLCNSMIGFACEKSEVLKNAILYLDKHNKAPLAKGS